MKAAAQLPAFAALAALLSIPLVASADIDDAINAAKDDMVEVRHYLHANPELSNSEFETAKYINKKLKALGIKTETGIAKTGVVGVLKGGKPGPVVAVRADMDALPVKEDTGFPFASTKTTELDGRTVSVAHACGHDVHMSVALGTATVLTKMRDELAGTVLFIFQPAEEGAPPGEEGGAPLMLKEGLFRKYKPEAIFGLHTMPSIETGKIGHTSGPAMASADRFRIVIEGKQSHGANPHQSIDPVVMASQAVLALQTIASRSLNPMEPAVVTVGIINGGDRFNIIPGSVELWGTVRAFSDDVQDTVERRMHEILDGITKPAGGSYTLDYERINPFLNNDPQLSARARGSLVRSLGENNVVDEGPQMIAEDFAWFAREVPGYYFRLGVRKPGTETGGLHTPTMRADDDSIAVGMRAMTGLVLDYLDAN